MLHCDVIFTGLTYEMLFWAIKEKPRGSWSGDKGTKKCFQKDRASRPYVSRAGRRCSLWKTKQSDKYK